MEALDLQTIAKEMWSAMRDLDYFQNDEVGQHLAKAAEALLRSPTSPTQMAEAEEATADVSPDPTSEESISQPTSKIPSPGDPNCRSEVVSEAMVSEAQLSPPDSSDTEAAATTADTVALTDSELALGAEDWSKLLAQMELAAAELGILERDWEAKDPFAQDPYAEDPFANLAELELPMALQPDTQSPAATPASQSTPPSDTRQTDPTLSTSDRALQNVQPNRPAAPNQSTPLRNKQSAHELSYAELQDFLPTFLKDSTPTSTETVSPPELESLEAATDSPFATEGIETEEPAYVESSPSVEDATALFQDAAESETEVFVTEEIAPAEPIDEEFEPSIEDAAALFDDAAETPTEAADPRSESLESAAAFFGDETIGKEEFTDTESTPSIEDAAALFDDAAEASTETVDSDSSLESAAEFFVDEAVAEEIEPGEPADSESTPSIEDAATMFDDAAPLSTEAVSPPEPESLEAATDFFATEGIETEEPAYVESSPSVEDATALFQDAAESETEVFVTEEIAPAEPIDEEFEPSIEDAAALFDDAAPATIEAADPESSLESAAEFFAPEEPAHAESFPSVEDVTALFQDAAESETEVFVTEEIAPAEPIDEEFEPSIEDAAALFDDAAETPTEAADPESESLESAAAFFVDEAVVAEEIEPGESASESSPQAAESDSAEQIEPVLPERLPTEFTHPQPRLPQQHENYATFITEAQDLLQTLEQELLALTPPAGPAEFQSLMRITHTLKGAAANVGQDTIQTIAHNLETVFRALLTPEVVLDAEIKTLLYRNYELLRLALQQELVQDHSHDAQLLQQATDILDQLQAQFGDATAELPAPPPAAELGFDLTEAIFETGVEARLKDFEALLARQPTPAKIQAYWHNQVDVFCRVADSLSLPGFRAVVEAGETAIATHPDQTLIIAPLLLANLRAAQAQILEGDRALTTQSNRTVSGSVSPELAHWLTPDHADASEPLDELDATPDVTPVPEQVVLASDLTPAKSEQPGSQPSSWAAPTPASDLAELVTAAPTSASVLSKSLRIDLTQLEQINHLVGELRINQNQMVLRDRQVQDVVHQLDTDLQQHRHTLQQLQASLPAEQQPALLGKAIDQTHRLKEGTNDLTVLIRNTDASLEREQQLAKQLQDQMDSARMVPLASMLKRFPPMVKQLALIHKKPVELHLQGTDVCVDKTLLENLYDALLHLVRNAFDHGLESAEQRRQADKPEQGNITIAAANQGNRTVIRVQDDGQGLNVAQICERAVARGLLSAEAAQNLKQQDLQQQSLKYQDLQERLPAPSQLEARLLDLLCTPGFSTVTAVSELSGRGVGLDVVKTQLAKIKGQLQVQSQPGQGCCFTLQIRESLLNARLLICQAGQAVYGFVTNEIEQVLIPGAKLRSLAGQKVLDWNQADQTYTVPIYGLAELFPPPNRWSGFPIEPNPEPNPALNSEPNPEPSNPDPTHPGELAPILTPQRDTCPVLLLRSPAGLVGLEVTQIWDEQELVIKPIAATIVPPSYVYGCTVLTNGQLALVLDGVLLVQWAQQQGLRRVQGDR